MDLAIANFWIWIIFFLFDLIFVSLAKAVNDFLKSNIYGNLFFIFLKTYSANTIYLSNNLTAIDCSLESWICNSREFAETEI